MSIDELREKDKNFDESMFLTKVANIFVKLLTCIMRQDAKDVAHFLTPSLRKDVEEKILEYKRQNRRQMYDELNVKDSKIISVEEKEDIYEIKVLLQSRYMDYIINLESGLKVSGDDTRRILVNYLLTFTKKKNTLEKKVIRRCPSCGSPMSVNTSGTCLYCHSVYNEDDYDWILTKIERY